MRSNHPPAPRLSGRAERRRPRGTALVAVLAMLLPLACGDSEETGAPERVNGANEGADRKLRELAERFATAVETDDARLVCRLISPTIVARSGGIRACIRAWEGPDAELLEGDPPDLTVEELTIEGATAEAQLANGGRLRFLRLSPKWYLNLRPPG